MRKRIHILSIDGGGVRGIVPSLFLKRLERDLGQPVSRIFDYIVGTSTGGILALGLTKPRDGSPLGTGGEPAHSAADMVDFYEKDGPKIFGRKRGIILPFRRARYDPIPLENVLKDKFVDYTLRDAIANVVVTAYDMSNRAPKVFCSWSARAFPGSNFYMRDVARASSAAPTYFPPASIRDAAGNADYHLVDGGVFANNPAARGFVEAASHIAAAGESAREREYLLISLGTGSLKRRYNYAETRNWGLLDWARPILDVVFDGVSDNVDHQLKVIFSADLHLGHYFRFQGDLEAASDDMDNTSLENMRLLRELANHVFVSQQTDYERATKMLSEGL
jgi:patatin-like phospholipase/acyl hydrolase